MCLFIETIRIENGKVFNVDLHNQRMNSTRSHFFGKINDTDLYNIIDPTPHKKLTKCRIVYGKEIVSTEYTPYQIRPVTSLKLIENNSIEYPWKNADRKSINELLALREDCDDILILKNGLVTDTSICNVALFNGHEWITPSTPLLKGTQRETLLRQRIIRQDHIAASDIFKYEQISLFNTMIDFSSIILPLTKIQT